MEKEIQRIIMKKNGTFTYNVQAFDFTKMLQDKTRLELALANTRKEELALLR